MERAGPGPNPAFAKTWSKVFVSMWLMDTVRMESSHAVLDCKRRDLRGVDDFFGIRRLWERGYFF